MNGYFQLQRRFFSHWLWTEESRVFSKAEAFLDLLQLAAFTRTRKVVGGSVLQLEPGQVCGSERYLAGRWGWSTKKVRAYLTLLEAERMVERQKKREGTILTLCNYDKYRAKGSTEEAPKKQEGSTEEAPRKQIEEGEEGVRENPLQKRGRMAPTVEACEEFACAQHPANKVWAASIARQFHATFERKDWITNSNENLLYKDKWKPRMLQMLEEEGRRTIARKQPPLGEKPKHANSYQEDIDLKPL